MRQRRTKPTLSETGQRYIQQYGEVLREEDDLTPITITNYLSDLQHFAAWCEATWSEGQDDAWAFIPQKITTPTITRYRAFLQTVHHLKPNSINRALITIKRYCAWAVTQDLLRRDPAKLVKLVAEVEQPPRHLTDQEEESLVAAVTLSGTLRDQTVIVLLLHTGLRAQELCALRHQDVHLGKRSGHIRLCGKRNKYREVPLNSTARATLLLYLETRDSKTGILFPSEKTGGALTVRALGHLVKKYVARAQLTDVSTHDLRHRFGYRMAEQVPLHRLAQIMGHDSLDTTLVYIKGTKQDLQNEVEKIAWA